MQIVENPKNAFEDNKITLNAGNSRNSKFGHSV